MRIFEFIRQVVYPFRYYLIGPILVILISAVDLSLRPYLIKLIVNSAMTKVGPDAVSAIWEVAPWFICMQFLIPAAWRFYDYCLMKYEPALHNHITKTLTDYALNHSHNYYQNNFAGGLASKIFNTPKAVSAIIVTAMNSFLTNFLGLLVAFYALWRIHYIFSLAILLWATAFIALSVLIISKFTYLAADTAEAGAKIMGNIVDSIGNVSSVRLFAGKPTELSKLEDVQKDYVNAMQSRRWFLLKFYSVQGLTFSIYQTACLMILIYFFGQGKVTAGDFAMLLTINILIVDSLWKMSNELRTFNDNWGTVAQTLKIIDQTVEVQDKPDAKQLVIHHGKISFDQVKFQYQGMDEDLFVNTTVTIEPGQKVGLVGYSGSGKSSFVNLILRLFDVSSGSIYIDGHNIKDVTQDSLRKNIAIIPQDPSLFHRTLLENIRYGRPDATDLEVIEAAKKAHAHDFITALPQGYNTLVGERGIKLSGGQRQRIALARAVLKNAPILILDEATSALDSVTESSIQDSLMSVMDGKTAIIISHRLSTLSYADRILVFEKGQVIQDGSHSDLLQTDGLYKVLWNTQADGLMA